MSNDGGTPVALTIAGSDSGGGAGIQADLKAFARCGVHGTTAIVALTAQNTVGVTAIHPIPPPMILDQVRAVASDIGVDAVKVGMLGDEGTIAAVVEAIGEAGDVPVVVDPVMIAESRAVLLDPAAMAALIKTVLPLATVATPNLPEALELTSMADGTSQEDLAKAVHAMGPRHVVVTGGHSEEGTDYFYDGDAVVPIPGPRHPAGATHGSGCTHSSALAAQLAMGMSPQDAARAAREIAAEAVASGLHDLGSGPGPVDVLGIAGRRQS
jgi:hydroxymethylpyrimidine/phosphomethylpyrimidine kinase